MSVAVAHHRLTEQPNLNKVLLFSLLAHLLVLAGLSLTFTSSIRIAPAAAIQVRLIGVPQPTAASKALNKPESVRTQDSAAPKEPPPDMKNIPPSEAKTKFLQELLDKVRPEDKPNPIEAKERPPVLDKNPDKKKVVKNDLNAKVVKNPEDFLSQLDDFTDKLDKASPKPSAVKPTPTQQPVGEGPEIQLNMADSGAVNAIRQHVERYWTIPAGKDLRGLQVIVRLSLSPDGNITGLQVVRGSGDGAFDNSLVRAVRKAVPLPIPHDKYDKFKEIDLAFAAG